MVYKDERSGILFYFERDGQHVSAIDQGGAVLWHVNPTEHAARKVTERDGNVWRPYITYAGPTSDRDLLWSRFEGKSAEFIAIGLGREFGLLDVNTGEYHFRGSD